MVTNIINGRIIAGDSIVEGVLVLKDGVIHGINKRKSPGAEVIDAEGMLVLPGGVDQHVHFSFTYKGSKVRGFETSNAAAVGGTTTVIEFVNQVKDKGLVDLLMADY